MHNILVFKLNGSSFSVNSLDRAFQSVPGFDDVRYNTSIGTPIEANYIHGQDFTTIRLDSQCETISLSGTSDVSLHAALILQEFFQESLRIIDTDYSFDLILSDFKDIKELRNAIDIAQAS